MEIDSKTIPSPPSTVQRETTIDPIDPIAPVNVLRDIAVGHKRLAWARQSLQEAEGHAAPRGTMIHRVALAGFEDEPPEIEQTDAQKSEFKDSTGLFRPPFLRISIPTGHCNK
jgi:hypothetical protein